MAETTIGRVQILYSDSVIPAQLLYMPRLLNAFAREGGPDFIERLRFGTRSAPYGC